MKNQNDLIVMIVAIVLGIGFSLAFFFMKREPIAPPAPQQVVTTKLQLPAAEPQWANGLPGGGNNAGSSSPFGGGSSPFSGGSSPFSGAPGGSFGPPAGMPGAPGGGKRLPGANGLTPG
jgi:hypothetical protein